MTPAKWSIRLTIKKIAEETCGIRPKAIPVTSSGGGRDTIFSVSIPFEYNVEVYSYLAQHLGIRRVIDSKDLTLTVQEACAIVRFVLKDTTKADFSVLNNSDEHLRKSAEEHLLNTPHR
jgi:hypothetical protein